MKILAVDDDPVFRQTFEAVLRMHDIQDLHLAESGAEALRIVQAQEEKFDCIFADIQMPGMDGIELAGTLRALDPSSETQIVMVTGMSGRSSIDKAFMAGADDYITKPLEPMEFKARMASIQRIHATKLQAAAMQSQLNAATSRQHEVDFEDPIIPPEVEGLISYKALRNYLQAIGRPRYALSQRIGFSIENAANIFVRTTDEEYLDILADVAEVIQAALKTRNVMLAYAGSGDFVAVAPAGPMAAADHLESEINATLEDYANTYLLNCFPVVRVGKPARGSFFSRRAIDDTLEDTISAARARVAASTTSMRKIA